MYFSISRAEGPVGTSRFLKMRGSSRSRQARMESRKWSIYFLSVGKPFFFFELSVLRTRGRSCDLKLRDRDSDLAISLSTSKMSELKMRPTTAQPRLLLSSSRSSLSDSESRISTILASSRISGEPSSTLIWSSSLRCSSKAGCGRSSSLLSVLSSLSSLNSDCQQLRRCSCSSSLFSSLLLFNLSQLSSASLERSFSSPQTISRFSAAGSVPYRNSRVSRSRLIYSSLWSLRCSLMCCSVLRRAFSEMDLVRPEREREWVVLCSGLREWKLSERQSSDQPSLMGRLTIFISLRRSYCFLREMVRWKVWVGCPWEELEDLSWSGNMSPSRQSMYLRESYSMQEGSDQLRKCRAGGCSSGQDGTGASSFLTASAIGYLCSLGSSIIWCGFFLCELLSSPFCMASRSFLFSSDFSAIFWKSCSTSLGLLLLVCEMMAMRSFHFCSSCRFICCSSSSQFYDPLCPLLSSSYSRLEIFRTFSPAMRQWQKSSLGMTISSLRLQRFSSYSIAASSCSCIAAIACSSIAANYYS